jgi:hypothetical protein
MAILTIEGTASRIFFNGKGVEVTETYKAQGGEMKTRKFTAWFTTEPNLEVGSSGTFTGTLSTKLDLWTNADGSPKLDHSGKQGQSINVAINGATFTSNGPAAPKSAAPLNEDMPF